MLAAVLQFGGALEHASAELRGDREVVLAAVANYGRSLYFASAGLKVDLVFGRGVIFHSCSATRYHISCAERFSSY